MVTLAQLIVAFPTNTTLANVSQPTFDFWAAQAYSQLNGCRLGAQIDYAALLFVAHKVMLDARTASGAPSAPLASKGVGGASASYDTANASIPGAGEYNATVYGQQLYRLMRASALGGLYVAPPHSVAFYGQRR